MHYDPIKKVIRRFVSSNVLLRKLFYRLLGLFFLREWYVKRAVRHTLKTGDGPLAILDAGSGFGQYAWYCARRYPEAEILGLELETAHVEDCKVFADRAGLTQLQFEAGDLLELNAEDVYNLILCVDVFEHIDEDEKLMRILCTALKPGGSLILSTPSLDRDHADDSAFVGEHVRDGYSREGIEKKLSDAGFHARVVEWSYGRFGDFAWRLLIRNTMILAGTAGVFGKAAAMLNFLLMLPLALPAMGIDFIQKNRRGTGLIVRAEKGSKTR